MANNLFEAKAIAEFIEIRKKVNECVLYLKSQGEPGKNYEGAWEIHFDIPDALEDPEAVIPVEYCKMTLYSYLLCPYSRKFEWRGRTFAEAVQRCKSDVEAWIEAAYQRVG